MTTFHRLAVPSYNGGLPAGYDYINNAVVGTPANANGVLTYGPNSGSYFVGYGDDGTSANANRPNLALAQNCDTLDNYLHQDLAVPAVTATITSSGDTSYTAGANTYVGKPGTPNTPEGILSFAKVLDQYGDEINVDGVAVAVASITGATVGTTWSSGSVTFNFNLTIPSGTVYQVWYATRSNLANLPIDALTNITIRTTQELPAAFEDFIKQVSTFSGLNVSSLVATLFQTPDGTRLPKASAQVFSVDPDGTHGGIHSWSYYIAQNASSRMIFQVSDSQTYTGTTGVVLRDTGVVDVFNGVWLVSDDNIGTYASLSAPYNSLLQMTSAFTQGSEVMKWEQQITSTDVTNGVDIGLVAHINARWTVTCGDGTSSFGDFTGADAIALALEYASNHSITSGVIQLKAGTYVVGASTLQTPNNSEFIIQGTGTESTIITGTVSSPGYYFTVGSASVLSLKDLTMEQGSATLSYYAVNFSGASLLMDNVNIQQLGLYANNPVVKGRQSNCLHVKGSAINMLNASAGGAVLYLYMTTVAGNGVYADQVSGLVFEDCQIGGYNSNSPIVLIQAANTLTGVASVSGLRFERCEILLGYATTSGGINLGGNSGVLYLDPNGMTMGTLTPTSAGYSAYPNIMFLRDASFIDCNVQAVANAGSNQSDILMHLCPFTNGASSGSPSYFAAIGQIMIKGGRWEVGDVNNGAHAQKFSPFFVSCKNLIVEDVQFKGSILGGNGQATRDAQYTVMGNGHSTAWTDSSATTIAAEYLWGAFTFAPGAQQVYYLPVTYADANSNAGVQDVKCGLRMKNVQIAQLPRDGGCGDLMIVPALFGNDVDGVTCSGYVDSNLGLGLPGFRAWVYNYDYAYGNISGIHLNGSASLSSGRDWVLTTGTYDEHMAFLRVTPGYGLTMRDCTVDNFFNYHSSSSANGMCLTVPPTGSSLYGCQGLVMENCLVTNCNHGYVAYNNSSTHPIMTARWYKCRAWSPGGDGWVIQPTNYGIGNRFVMDECYSLNAGSNGFSVTGEYTYHESYDYENDTVILTKNVSVGSGSYDFYYGPGSASGYGPGGSFLGNDCGAVGEVFANEAGSALSTSTQMRGFETGYSSTGVSMIGDRSYDSGTPMLFNSGLLIT